MPGTTLSSSVRGSTRWPRRRSSRVPAGTFRCSSATTVWGARSAPSATSRSPGSPMRCCRPGTRSSWARAPTPSWPRSSRVWTRVPQPRAPDSLAVPRRLGRVPLDLARGEHRRVRAAGARRRGGLETQVQEFMGSAELSFGVLSSELWSPQGLSLARSAYRKLGRRGLLAFGGATLASARDWLEATFASDAARGLLAPWVLHTGLGRRAGCLRVHDPGDRLCRPARRHAGAEGRRHPARRGAPAIVREGGASFERAPMCSGSSWTRAARRVSSSLVASTCSQIAP